MNIIELIVTKNFHLCKNAYKNHVKALTGFVCKQNVIYLCLLHLTLLYICEMHMGKRENMRECFYTGFKKSCEWSKKVKQSYTYL